MIEMGVNNVYLFLSSNLGNNNGWFTFNDIVKGTGLCRCTVLKSIKLLKERNEIYRKDIRYEELGLAPTICDGSYIMYKAKRI